jgi:hypothetical protein
MCEWEAADPDEEDDAEEAATEAAAPGAEPVVAPPAVRIRRSSAGDATAASDASGAFTLTSVAAGRGTLTVSGEEARRRPRSEPIAGPSGSPAAPERPRVVPAVVPLLVRAAVPGAAGLDGRDCVVLKTPAAAPGAPPVETAHEVLEVRLVEAATIAGRVVGPLDELEFCDVLPVDEAGNEIGEGAEIGEDGRFEISDVPAGATVTLTIPWLEDEWGIDGTVVARAGDRDVEIRVVSQFVEITATLLDADGAPATGRRVIPHYQMPSPYDRWLDRSADRASLVGADGRFTFLGVGGAEVPLWVDGLFVGTVTAGNERTLRMPKVHRLAGTVRSADGAALPEWVWIEIDDASTRIAQRVIDGRFEFAAVPAGARIVKVLVGEPRGKGDDGEGEDDEDEEEFGDLGEDEASGAEADPARPYHGFRGTARRWVRRVVTVPQDEIEIVLPQRKGR